MYIRTNENNFKLEKDLLMSLSGELPSVESVPLTVGTVADVTPPETLEPEVVLCVAVLPPAKYTSFWHKIFNLIIYSSLHFIVYINVPRLMANTQDERVVVSHWFSSPRERG